MSFNSEAGPPQQDYQQERPPQTPQRQSEDVSASPAIFITSPVKLETIPSLRFDEASIEMPPPISSPTGNKFSSSTASPMYRNNNSSATSLNNTAQNRRGSTSLNYIPSLSQPPPPQGYVSHSHTNSQSSVRRSRSPIRSKSPIRSPSPIRTSISPIRGNPNPFNFKSTTLMMHNNGSNGSLNLPPQNKTQYRRGHRYKHSSVSMNLFQEPPKRAPLNVPQTFSIPNFKEILNSLAFMQKIKLVWCLSHILFVAAVFTIGLNFNNSLLLTLAHLCFYDVLSNLIVVIVDIMTNFECWNNSSLQYPFGLGRIEVLVGFGLSVSLIFVGGDLISHLLEELIIKLIMGDTNHNEEILHHNHSGDSDLKILSPFYFEVLIGLIIVVTLISSNILLHSSSASPNSFKLFNKNHLIHSSTSFLTLSFASYSLLYPLLSRLEIFESINDLSTLAIAILICIMAWKLINTLSYILLIGYPYDSSSFNSTISSLTNEIQNIDGFKSVYKIENIIISKVNYKTYIIILHLKMFGSTDEDESKIRFYATKAIKTTILREEMGIDDETIEFNDQKNNDAKFEITIDIDRF